VLEDGPAHMVAESPNAPFWTVGATAYRRKQMAAARTKVRVCEQARIVGVVFWDRPQRHRQDPERDRAAPDSRLRLLLGLGRAAPSPSLPRWARRATPNWKSGDTIPLGDRTFRVVALRDDDADHRR
jgi:hypothetical protein